MNICVNPAFHHWMKRKLAPKDGIHGEREPLQKLYIAGCTTTSCIRISACDIKRGYPDLDIIVILDLCGARVDNYVKNAETDETLVRIYGKETCIGKSPVDLAVLQMTRVGVKVI